MFAKHLAPKFGELVGHLVGWLVGWSFGQSVGQSVLSAIYLHLSHQEVVSWTVHWAVHALGGSEKSHPLAERGLWEIKHHSHGYDAFPGSALLPPGNRGSQPSLSK